MGLITPPFGEDSLARRWADFDRRLRNLEQRGAVPYLAWTVTTSAEIVGVTVTSATFVETHQVHGSKLQPAMRVEVLTFSDAATTGEVQLVDLIAGTVVSPVVAIPASDLTYRDLTGPVTGASPSTQRFAVQARRLTGSGNIRVSVTRAEGL